MTSRLDLPCSSFCSTEKSVVPSAAGTTTSASIMALPALIRQASVALAEAPGPAVAAAGEDLDGVVMDVQLDAIAVLQHVTVWRPVWRRVLRMPLGRGVRILEIPLVHS
jgi:hypothetical protein